ncbi:CRISPR-associated helicase Cas3' [Spirosoma sp. SC4-14]|uniref:CRISPR-associated helicase Cas3' n=1 Tax=Spirosoma sp. SC4-14 TaxID=3128900 RepID=UPI0030D43354
METWRLFWAKTNREKIDGLPDDWTHPLWAHLIDVGSAAQILWDNFLPLSLKQKMADALGMSLDDAGRFLSIWIGLHDLGKGIPSFQGIPGAAPEVVKKLADAGLHIHPEANRLHHGHASIAIVRRWLHPNIDEDRMGKPLPEFLLDALATCVGIHHGKLSLRRITDGVAEDRRIVAVLGDSHWKQTQLDLANAVFNAWDADWPLIRYQKAIDRRSGTGWPDWMMAFAGWATLADWLGSMQTCYDHKVQADDDLANYLKSSHEGALKAYEVAGLKHQAGLRVESFEAHFGNKPRPLQEIARDVVLDTNVPNLLIVEAPTGEGKTEAAFYLAGRFGQGIYAAMPSQSTSDGLFPRLATFLKGDKEQQLLGAHVGEEAAALRLVHGNDLLRDDALSLLDVENLTASIVDDDDDERTLPGDTGAKNRLLSWFMPKKRALLVPYGVGTVDQLFLGVLFAKHFFLRLFALCGKTIIFDEVHAYDTYMNTLFGRLLPWLRALDINVVVLSATLPGEARRQMLTAWGTPPDLESDTSLAPYPVTWQSAGGKMAVHPFKPDSRRGQRLHFQWCSEEIATMANLARTLISEGATVLIICNKVDRAQQLFDLLDNDTLLPPEDRLLLHARMPQAWRQQREEKARERFGPKRPDRSGLLVGTQVIEQSLDLDADAMITDLAPVDLLLQRAGRLHRHHRDNRPTGYESPMLYIACPEAESGDLPDVDELSAKGRIYGRKLLWQTWSVLRQSKGWALPLGDGTLPGYRELVERVYDQEFSFPYPLTPATQADYEKANEDWSARNGRQQADADGRLIPPPNHMQDLFQAKENLLTEDEDNPNGNVPAHLQAFTRDPEGVNAEVLLLHRTNDGWSLTPNGDTLIRRGKKQYMPVDLLRSIFGAAVRISHGGIISALWKEPNEDWQKQQEENRLLKRFQLIELTDYTATVGGIHIELNDRLGLIYDKP